MNNRKKVLFSHAPQIAAQVKQWQKQPKMHVGSKKIVSALAGAGLKEAASDSNFAKHALLAYQNEEISEAQISSVLMYWGAVSDYGSKMRNVQFHQLTASDQSVKTILEAYLNIENIYQLKHGLTENELAAMYAELFAADIPKSERTFVTFDIPTNAVPSILHELLALNFTLFMPKQSLSGWSSIIVPSHSIIQAVFNQLPEKVQFVPMLGELDADAVNEMHENMQHPSGLSAPGCEHKEADGHLAGKDGFCKHDIYHGCLFAFNTMKKACQRMIQIAKKVSVQNPNNRDLAEAVEKLIDSEFRWFLRSEVLGKRSNASHATAEYTLVVGILSAFANAKDEMRVVNRRSDADFTSIYRYLIEDMVRNRDEWLQLGFEVYHVIAFMNPANTDYQACKLSSLQERSERISSDSLSEEFTKFEQTIVKLIIEPGQNLLSQLYQRLLRTAADDETSDWLNQFIDSGENGKIMRGLINIPDAAGMTPLHKAIATQNYQTVCSFIACGADVNQAIERSQARGLGGLGNTRAFHLAAQADNVEIRQIIYDAGADPYVLDENGMSAADYSVARGEVAEIKKYLQLNVITIDDISRLDRRNMIHCDAKTVLTRFIEWNDELTLFLNLTDSNARQKKLQELCNNPDGFSLHGILADPRLTLDEFKYILRTSPLDLNRFDSKGDTLLMRLSREGMGKKIQVLIEYGAQVDKVKARKRSALDVAISLNHREAAEILYANGAKSSNTSFYAWLDYTQRIVVNGNTPEAWQDCFPMLKLLIEHGYPLNAPLISTTVGEAKIAHKMLASTVWSMLRGYGIMHADMGKVGEILAPLEVRTYCILQGADPNQADYAGNPELATAIKNNWLDYAELLLRNHADPNVTLPGGGRNTLLHLAVGLNKPDFVLLLIKHGAIQTVNNNGQTPLQLAERLKSFSCVKLLREAPIVSVTAAGSWDVAAAPVAMGVAVSSTLRP